MPVQEIEINITGLIPADAKQIAARFGWLAQVDDGKGGLVDNPQSALSFYESHLEKMTFELLRASEQDAAGEAARNTAGAAVDARIGAKRRAAKKDSPIL